MQAGRVLSGNQESVRTGRGRFDIIASAGAGSSLQSLKRTFTEFFTITEKATTRAFSWLKVPASAFTFKAKLRNYAKECKLCLFAHLDSRYLSVKAFRETFVVTPSIIYII